MIDKLIATAELKGVHTTSTPSTPAHTNPTPSPTPTMLDDLDLSGGVSVIGSRPIGGEGKHRTASSVTLISSAAIAELVDEDGGRGKHPDMLREMGVALYPGTNRLKLSGQVFTFSFCNN